MGLSLRPIFWLFQLQVQQENPGVIYVSAWRTHICTASVDCLLWVLLPLPCWRDLFKTLCLDYSTSHFALQSYCCIFVVWSLPDCGRLSVAWRRIFDSMTYFYWRWVFLLARTVQTLALFVSPSNRTLVSSMSWTQRWISPPHKRSYCLGSCCAPSSCFMAQRMLSHCSLIFFVCQTYAVTLLELFLFETGK